MFFVRINHNTCFVSNTMFFIRINQKRKEWQTIHDQAQHGGKQKRFACRVINLRSAFEWVKHLRLGCVLINHEGECTGIIFNFYCLILDYSYVIWCYVTSHAVFYSILQATDTITIDSKYVRLSHNHDLLIQ